MELLAHPDNAVLTADGPVLIDRTNARDGSADLDVAAGLVRRTAGG